MEKRKAGAKEGKGEDSPSQLIDARIKELQLFANERRPLTTGAAHTGQQCMNVDACADRLRRQWHRSLMEQPARVSKKARLSGSD